ncbi:MAG: heavy metal translocating P-type ATPase [SAR324 cluster bacterium]|uniref:Heavy metal translocating P-type ATPase n=1 Tax=SAR324 cluster bacterium TaxID=2024889 RepID=A0A2A4TBK8_9DELT|nr:MAG: heavy metal translocating P-type ATPase [SAR324 cluster bacterium]
MLPLLVVAGGVLSLSGIKFFKTLKSRQEPEESKIPLEEPESLQSKDEDIKESEKEFEMLSVLLGTTVAGVVWYPALLLPSMAGYTYLAIPMWKRAFESLKKGKVDGEVLNSIAIPGIMLSGYYLIGAADYWLYALANKFIAKIKADTQKKLTTSFDEMPATAWWVKDGTEIQTPVQDLVVGDIIVVNSGEMIPVDGIVTEGLAAVNQHMLTGESQLAEKIEGAEVFAATTVLSGKIYIKVTAAGTDTVRGKISDALNSTLNFDSKTLLQAEKLNDHIAGPLLVVGALVWPIAGVSGSLAVIGTGIGENMRISGSLSTFNFLKKASEQGVLVKSGQALELLSQVDTVVFDKTGTLTDEQPYVSKIYHFHGYTEDVILSYAAAAEYKHQHPIARAVLQEAINRNVKVPEVDDAQYEQGYGIRVNVDGRTIHMGSQHFMTMENIAISEDIERIIADCHESGFSMVFLAVDSQLVGMIELHATIRKEAWDVIEGLKAQNISVYIISGDHEKPTKYLAEKLGIENYYSETLPKGKAKIITQLKEEGKIVCFIGDGLNDAIALKTAHVGISMQGASSLATDTAQVVLMNNNLTNLCDLFELSSSLERNYKRGLFLSIAPEVIIVGSVFLFNMGLVGAVMVYYASLGINMVNSILPLDSSKNTKSLNNNTKLLEEK